MPAFGVKPHGLHRRFEQRLDALPVGAEGFHRFVHVAHGRFGQGLRRNGAECRRRLQHRGIGRTVALQVFGDVGDDVHRAAQQLLRVGGRNVR